MLNSLTSEVESWLGASFISLFAVFMIGFVFIVLKNFNTDLITLDSSNAQVKTISSTERTLIANWVKENEIKIPRGEGYRYVIQKYPTKPWIK